MKVTVRPSSTKVIRVADGSVRVVRVTVPARVVRVYWAAGVGPRGADGAGFTWRGPWVNNVAYAVNELVSYDGSSWIAIAATTGDTPGASPTKWELFAQEGATGPQGPPGSGGGGSSTFLALTDTPDAFVANADYVVTNNGGGTALQFRRLNASAFFTLTVNAFTPVAASSPFAGSSNVERGYAIPNINWSWTVNDAGHGGSASITGFGNPGTFAFTGTSGSGNSNGINATDPGGGTSQTRTWTISIDGQTRNGSINWYYRAFFGWSSNANINTENGVEALSLSGLYANRPTSVNVTGNGGTNYAYYAQPTNWTAPSLFRDLATGFELSMTELAQVTLVNPYGVSQAYRVWRTTNATAVASLNIGVE